MKLSTRRDIGILRAWNDIGAANRRLGGFLILLAIAIFFEPEGPRWHIYIQTHYYFSYEEEFLKRAFVGNLASVLGFPARMAATVVTYGGVGILAAGFIAAATFAPWPNRRLAFALTVFFLGCSATFRHYLADYGRFDVLWFVLLGLNIAIIYRTSATVAAVATVGLLTLAMLIHEAAFFATAPLAITLLYFRTQKVSPALWAAVGCSIALILILVLGVPEEMSFRARTAVYALRYGDVDPGAIQTLYFSTVDNILLTIENGLTLRRLEQHLVFAAVLWPFGFFVFVLAREAWARPGWDGILVLVAAFGPLALYPVAHDHFRWWSLVMTNVIFVTFVFVYQQPAIFSGLVRRAPRLPGVLWFGTCMSLMAGPSGDTSAFFFS